MAFLYDPGLLEVPADEVFFHVVMRRNATREIVQVNFRTHRGRTWAVFGNHWPSRSGGAFESSGYRHIAGGDAVLLPSARPGGTRRRHTGVGDGRLQR